MNRMFFAVVSAICVVCPINPVAAQSKTKKPIPTVAAAEKLAPAGTTRVAVINLGYVLNKYDRAAVVKEEMQTELNKLREEAKKQMENINLWQSALQKNEFPNGTREQYEEKLIVARRRFEDLNRTAQTKIGKTQQAQLLTLWNDVHEAVRTYSAAHGIDLVMAYGEPLEKKDVMAYANIDRKMRGADQGGTVPFFIGSNVDISEAIVELLNRRYRDDKEKATEESSGDPK